ncbi:MAG: transcriptional regulator [Polyangiaceae bacterium]|nr:transcriptional regulator [Polyangiaceae bacterium]
MIEPVVDEVSHRKALRRIEQLWDAAPGSSAERELDALATLVDAYERRTSPIVPPDPVEAISMRLEALGLTRRDLEPLIGSRARVSEVLSRKRALTLPMIRRVHERLGIPAEILILEPRPLRKAAPAARRPKNARTAAAPARSPGRRSRARSPSRG